jgi:hypothetical protein
VPKKRERKMVKDLTLQQKESMVVASLQGKRLGFVMGWKGKAI